jgi:alginate O-acetyltransferase complex protein AlgI
VTLPPRVYSLHWTYWALFLGIVALLACARRFAAGAKSREWLFVGTQLGGLLLIGDIGKGGLLGVALPLACVVFLLGRVLERLPPGASRRRALIGAIALPVLVLAVGKYAFAARAVDRIAIFAGLRHAPVVVVGLSYLVFKAVHYLVDVAAGRIAAPGFRSYLAFMAFLPTFLSGPMDRYDRFRRDFENPAPLDRAQTADALWRIVVGLFKKYVLAAVLAPFAFPAFATTDPGDLSVSTLWMAMYAYGFQIYFDFAGYSDLAVGSGRLFGIRVPENFRAPYLARNIIEFWNGWHMTLSGWLRDYLFMPIGKSLMKRSRRGGTLRVAAASYVATFAVAGAWHGDGLNFVAWGIYQGLGLSACKWYGDATRGFPAAYHRFAAESVAGRVLAVALTFHFVMLGWILFAHDLPRAAQVFLRMFGGR